MSMEIDTRIAGIPCIAKLTHMLVQRPLGASCDSDVDCYGYTEIDYVVCDRHGYLAPWLERKMTEKDDARIREEFEMAVADSH